MVVIFFLKTTIKILKTCCKAVTDHHTLRNLHELITPKHLRHFFSENSCIIDEVNFLHDVIFH